MKSSLLKLPAVLVLGLGLQCSDTPENNGLGKSESTRNQGARSRIEDDVELKRRSEAMARALEAASKTLAVENLKTMRATDEIRVWVGFGRTHPRLFILQQLDGRRANYLTMTTLQASVSDRQEETPTKTTLGPPNSGWNEFDKFLTEHGIHSPLRLSRESSQYIRSPDVQVIVIEIKSRDNYDMAFFHVDNNSDSAQKARAVCQRIEQDFEINMYCDPSQMSFHSGK